MLGTTLSSLCSSALQWEVRGNILVEGVLPLNTPHAGQNAFRGFLSTLPCLLGPTHGVAPISL